MKLFFAQYISILFHPFILSIPAAFMIVYRTSGDVIYSIKWVIVTSFFTGIIVGFVLLGMMVGFFTDFDVSVQKDRVKFYLFSIVITLLYMFSVVFFSGPRTLLLSIFVLLLGIVTLDLLNFKIKTSVHAASATALFLGLVILYGGFFYLLILLIPIIIWSRIVLKRHTLQEGVAGSILGAALAFGIFIVVKYFG